jgi:hypothetical protein
MTEAHPLLAPLTEDQRHLVDVVAEAFTREDYEWPFFDYVEGILDYEGRNAIEVLQSFPTIGRFSYGAVVWSRNDSREAEVGLTVVGMSHSSGLRGYVPAFFELVDYLAARRRQMPPKPRQVRNLTVSSEEFDQYWKGGRRLGLSARLTAKLKEHEPAVDWGTGSFDPDDGSWTTTPSRRIFQFEGMTTIEEYVERLEEFMVEPAPALPPILPSPLSLAATLDYLNVVWQLTHERARLFDFAKAERVTRLAFDVQTQDEFAAHLSALADVLREADKRLDVPVLRKERGRVLAKLQADIASRVDADGADRVAEAISTLRNVVTLRDAEQHGDAGARGVVAYRELRVAYPPTDWRAAWSVVSTHAISALNVLREELEASA